MKLGGCSVMCNELCVLCGSDLVIVKFLFCDEILEFVFCLYCNFSCCVVLYFFKWMQVCNCNWLV